MDSWEWWLARLADGATIVTGFAVVFALVQFFQSRKQRCRDADQWYVDRYWLLQDQKSVKRRIDGSIKTVVPLHILHAELRLCEDELDARANGWVTNDSWTVWSPSIIAMANDRQAMSLLERLPRTEMVRLREYLLDSKDPQQISVLTQVWRGIK